MKFCLICAEPVLCNCELLSTRLSHSFRTVVQTRCTSHHGLREASQPCCCQLVRMLTASTFAYAMNCVGTPEKLFCEHRIQECVTERCKVFRLCAPPTQIPFRKPRPPVPRCLQILFVWKPAALLALWQVLSTPAQPPQGASASTSPL